MNHKHHYYLLLICVDQLLIIPVLQLPRGLCNGQRGVENEELASTLSCLQKRGVKLLKLETFNKNL